MLKNYLTIALRSLRKQRGYAVINILGLAVGVACCLFLLLFVRDELSYDRFHSDAEAIYRVNLHVESLGGPVGLTPTIVAPLFKREFPEVQAATRVEAHGGVVRVGQRVFDDTEFYFADSTFFKVFDGFTLLAGTEETALTRPNTVLLMASTAERFFGEENPIGQTLIRNNDQEFTVTGVMADVPSNSHFDFDFLGSFASRERWANNEMWGSANFFTFIRLPSADAAPPLQVKIDALIERLEAAGEQPRSLVLQPLTDIHLGTDVAFDLDATGDITYVYGFITVALLILLIACINYMNLATARSAQRAKEVGLRKSLGALRGQLMRQFYSESALLALSGLVLALGLVALGLPWFNALSGKALTLETLASPGLIALIVGIFVVVSLVAGSYPAFYLSKFQPVRVLRGGRTTTSGGAAWLRKGLVVLQFSISAILIAGTLIVLSQLRYMNTQALGFDKEHLVVLPLNDPILQEQYPTMEEALRQHPSVVATAGVNQIPGQLGWTSGFHAEGLPDEEAFLIKGLPAETRVVEGLGLDLIAGRGFPETLPEPDSSTYQYVLNETTVRRLGWTSQEAIGRRVAVDSRWGEVVGVAKDFHFRSLHEAIEPLAIWYEPRHVRNLVVRLAPGATQDGMEHLEAVWERFAAHRPFSYRFLDAVYDRLYRNERQMGQVVSVFAFLAIFVACLGLFGLTSFTAERRTREIGVRKVLGATVPHIVTLLSKEFVLLVGIAFVIALPLAWLGMRQWLDSFAYHIDLGPVPFVAAGVLLLLIALLTVSYQALRAALADPVKSLRYE